MNTFTCELGLVTEKLLIHQNDESHADKIKLLGYYTHWSSLYCCDVLILGLCH
jgi:hypothetical protein